MEKKANSKVLFKVIGASSLGTMIEWYDFFIFGSLATVISTKFFPSADPTAAFLSTLATFAAGFVVRPFGALVFGRLGDLVGRKHTFMVTLLLMGGATFLIGCVPSYEAIGFWAPALVLLLRLLQGLALGGEYGGAATYVAEHASDSRRGFFTSWIQATATLGLFISLIVILSTRALMTESAFDAWGWRVPFWFSILMIVVSYFIRRNMNESPVFTEVKASGKIEKNPLKASFGKKKNFKLVLLALFGMIMGQGVIWYTSQFYAMSFLEHTLHVDKDQVDSLLFIALILGTPLYILFGWLSDKWGRKWIMLSGMLLAVIFFRPIYEQMYQTVNLEMKIESQQAHDFETVKTSELGANASRKVRETIHYIDGTSKRLEYGVDSESKKIAGALEATTIFINKEDEMALIGLIFLQILFATMIYGPMAAFLVELFPANIRYTSMSLPYHIGNGVFGGMLPAVSTYLVTNAHEQNQSQWYLEGLWYPILISAVCFLIGTIYISRKTNSLDEDREKSTSQKK